MLNVSYTLIFLCYAILQKAQPSTQLRFKEDWDCTSRTAKENSQAVFSLIMLENLEAATEYVHKMQLLYSKKQTTCEKLSMLPMPDLMTTKGSYRHL